MSAPYMADGPTRPIGDELFFVVFDEYGRGRLSTRVAGLALAGALLAELAFLHEVSVSAGTVAVPARVVPADALRHVVVETMRHQSQHTDVHTWLAFLGRRAIRDVGERLERAGLVTAHPSRRGGSAWVPTDRTQAAWPLARLRVFLRNGREFSRSDAILLSLCHAAGLGPEVLRDCDGDGREYAELLLMYVEQAFPGVAEVIAHLAAAVGDVTLHHRT